MEAAPDAEGWRPWRFPDPTRVAAIIGPIAWRLDAGIARVRWTAERRHSNVSEHVHGGALLAFIDVSLFVAARGFGLVTAGSAVTVDLSAQFIGGGRLGEPIEARVELLKETGRLVFLRGLIVQGADDAKVAAFSGTIRKPPVK